MGLHLVTKEFKSGLRQKYKGHSIRALKGNIPGLYILSSCLEEANGGEKGLGVGEGVGAISWKQARRSGTWWTGIYMEEGVGGLRKR